MLKTLTLKYNILVTLTLIRIFLILQTHIHNKQFDKQHRTANYGHINQSRDSRETVGVPKNVLCVIK